MKFSDPPPANATVTRGIDYGRAAGESLLLDASVPPGNGSFPIANP